MEFLDLADELNDLKQYFQIITGVDGNDPFFKAKKEDILSQIIDIKNVMNEDMALIDKMKNQIDKDRILLEKLKNAEKFIDYLENNIPESTEHVNTPSFNGQSKEETLFYNLLNKKRAQGEVSPYPSNWSTFLATPKENIQNTPCIKSKKEITSRICIPHVTSSELIKVPSYMRGRIQLTAINSCIDSFNTTLNKKYNIMKQKKSALKAKDLDMFLSWKEQNNIRNDDNYCTPDDLINLAGFKMDKAAYSIITILRHLKRLQEVKLKGMKSRYIVIDD